MAKSVAAICRFCSKPFVAKFKIDLGFQGSDKRVHIFTNKKGSICLKDSKQEQPPVYFCCQKCCWFWKKQVLESTL